MGIEGNLKTVNFGNFLQFLTEEKRTGVLHLKRGNREKRIMFIGGEILLAASNHPRELFTNYVAHTDWVVERPGVPELLESHRRDPSAPLGQRLVQSGLVNDDELHRLLMTKIQDTVLDLLTWKRGTFVFDESDLPFQLPQLGIETSTLILEGMKLQEEIERCHEILPSPHAIFLVVGSIDPRTPFERRVLAKVVESCTLREVCEAVYPVDHPSYRVIAAWVEKGLMEFGGERIPDDFVEEEDEDGRKKKAPEEGDVVAGRYQLVEAETVDGPGITYEAIDRETQDSVSVKIVVPPQNAGPGFLARLLEIAERARAVVQDTVLPVRDLGVMGGVFYLVTDHCSGLRLDELAQLQNFRNDPDRVLEMFGHVIRALETAHAGGVIHGDLRPDQIILLDDTPYLADLGLPVVYWELGLATREQELGTPVFTAPELLEDLGGSVEPGPQSDVYSLAALLYFVLASRSPHLGGTAASIRDSHRSGEPPPLLSELRDDLPDGLSEVVARAVAVRRIERYPTIQAFREALETLDVEEDAEGSPWARVAVALVVAAALGVGVWFGLVPRSLSASDIDAMVQRADLYYQSEQYLFPANENAVDLYRAILEADPDHDHSRERIEAIERNFLTRSKTALEGGRTDEARAWLEKATRVAPDSIDVRRLREQIEGTESAP